MGGLWQVLAHPPRFEPVVEGARTSARLHRSCPFGPTRTWSHTRHAQGLCVVSTIARNSLIIWDAERRRGRRKQRGGAVGYGRYRTLQTPEIQPSSRGREHRRNRGAECDPRPFSRSAHRRSVRAACGGAAGALAGRLRRRRGCSPGESGLPASPRPSRLARAEPARAFAPFVAAGVGGVRAGGIAEQRLTAPRRRRLDTRLVESAT